MYSQIRSDILKRTIIRSTYLCSYRRLYETHYDVLKLPQDCSARQIKDAFIKLSKEHHPDVNKSEQSHARFQKISDAYNVLGKPKSRRSYDLGLIVTDDAPTERHAETYHERTRRDPWSDPTFWVNRDKTEDERYEKKGYYGIKGVNRVSNSTIAALCFLLGLTGLGLQFLAVSKSTTFRRQELARRSAEAQEELDRSRAMAVSNGNRRQVELLKIRLMGGTRDE